jgi:WD40 repeat protein
MGFAAEEKPVVLPVEKTLATQPHYTSVDAFAFSPDGKKLAACNGTNVVHIWDFPLTRATGHSVLPAEKIKAGCVMLAFSRDGSALAVVNSYDYRSSYDLSLWDAQSLGQSSRVPLLHPPINISHPPSFMAFTTDGQWVSLVSEGPEETIWEIYSLDYGELSERVCREYKRNLSLDEWDKFVGPDTPYECTCPSAPKANDAPACRQ